MLLHPPDFLGSLSSHTICLLISVTHENLLEEGESFFFSHVKVDLLVFALYYMDGRKRGVYCYC